MVGKPTHLSLFDKFARDIIRVDDDNRQTKG